MERFPSHDSYGGSKIVFFTLVSNMALCCHGFSNVSGCLDSEREALITFRKALIDPTNLLSSWDDDEADHVPSDCCKWRGVSCDNTTGHVVKLDLHSEKVSYLDGLSDLLDPVSRLSGQIHPALLRLKHLHFLDLSFNAFNSVPIPEFLGFMKELRHLNLSKAGFSGKIPHQLGNLSNLISLNLSSNVICSDDSPYLLSVINLWWMTNLTSLKYLDMSHVDLSLADHDWVHVMNHCPSLVELRLRGCSLSYVSPSLAFVNFTSLWVLDLSSNNFNSTIPNWIANISSLVSLNLSCNHFHGLVPYQFSKLPNLEELSLGAADDNLTPNWSEILEGSWSKLKRLDLSFSYPLNEGILKSISNITSLVSLSLFFNWNIIGSIPKTFTNLVNLESLALYGYHTHGRVIPDWLDQLKSLSCLVLSDCMLAGPIPTSLGRFSFLKKLDLSINQLNGTIPAALGRLSSLQVLDLSMNQLNGTIPTALGQLSNLVLLDVSSNYLTGNFSERHLENLSNLEFLNLSHNMVSSQFPNHLKVFPHVRILDLSFNKFFGPLPPNFTAPNLYFFSISNNQIDGTIPSSIGEMAELGVLNLSQNKIRGTIPSSLGDCVSLEALDLSRNHLSGRLPKSLGQLSNLKTMHLRNNCLSGRLPIPLRNCGSLETLDLGDNNFSGSIPTWIGTSFPALRILLLRSNHFTGRIPPQLSCLASLQVLDVAQNGLSGLIPPTFENLTAMKKKSFSRCPVCYGMYYEENLLISVKGLMLEFTRTLSLVTCIDLSNNNFSGEIPEAITSLLGLHVLNLSGNYFTGKIPDNIGSLVLLESLDFSRNQLSGAIPPSMADLNFLSCLNFSYNKLSGRMPLGWQLQTLISDPSVYIGNDGLCGTQLIRNCDGDKTSEGPMPINGHVEEEKDHEKFWFYLGIGYGFVVGFWTICGILFLKKSWQIAYFRFFEEVAGQL